MTDYTTLVTALRTKDNRDNRKLLDAAADAIERLQKERNEAVRNLRGSLHGSCIYCRHNVKGRCKASPTLDEMQYGACWEWRGIYG